MHNQSFGTLFDQNYLSRGLALRHSLRAQKVSFCLYILCLDERTFDFFQEEEQSDTVSIPLGELENYFPELVLAKENRNWAEYIFTLSPCWPLFLLDRFPHISVITTMDADLYFFSDPTVLLGTMEFASVLITPHRFSKHNLHLVNYGLYNVSFQAFKKDQIGIACLEKWKEDCLDWCYDRLEPGRFADQKYLDGWKDQFGPKIVEVEDHGSGLAPWNIGNVQFELRNGELFVDGSKFIFFHFHNLRFVRSWIITSGLSAFHAHNPKLFRYIYEPYIHIVSSYAIKIGQLSDRPTPYRPSYSLKQVAGRLLNDELYLYLYKSLFIPLHLKKLRELYAKINSLMKKIYGLYS